MMQKLQIILISCFFTFVGAGASHADNGFSDVEHSPDKNFFVARMTAPENEGRILVVDVKGKKAIAEFAKPRDGIIDWYEWVNDNRVVYQIILKSEKAGAVNGLTLVYAMDRDGGNRRQIYGYGLERSKRDTRINIRKEIKAQIEIVDTLVEDKKNVLVAEYPLKKVGLNNYVRAKGRAVAISRLDVYSGKRKKVKTLSYEEALKYRSS